MKLLFSRQLLEVNNVLVEIREKSFNAYQEIESFENNLDIKGEYGATASFIGSMRDFNETGKFDLFPLPKSLFLSATFFAQLLNSRRRLIISVNFFMFIK